MVICPEEIEFDLTIKKFRNKNARRMELRGDQSEIEREETEKLEFKALSAKEVLRKLIDYLN